MMAVARFLLLMGVVVFTNSQLPAQTRLLSARMRGVSSTIRSGAPVGMEWTLRYEGNSLLEGHLKLQVFDGRQQLVQLTVEDLALAAGEQGFFVMLPAVVSASQWELVEIRATFHTEKETIDLGPFPMRVPPPYRRSFVTCVCSAKEPSMRSAGPDFVYNLEIRRFNPTSKDPLIGTYSVYLLPDDLPANPLQFCSFDMVVVDGTAFGQLRQKQMRALMEWVEAGGSLCVVPDGSLSAQHVDFINQLLGSKDRAVYTRTPQGRLLPVESDLTTKIRMARKGLGRAVVIEELPSGRNGNGGTDGGFDSSTWRRAVSFLWKFRRDQPVVATGKWRLGQPPDLGYQNGYARQPGQLTLQPLRSIAGLVNQLRPPDVKVLPLELLGFMLFVYVLAIGPADYIGLGWLKQRKLTWIVFPLVTVGFTLMTVWMAHASMASNGHRKAAVFLDIGDDGRVVRENRFELLFSGAPQTVSTELSQTIFTALNHEQFDGTGNQYGYGQPSELVAPPEYRGRVPLRYRAIQHLPQWTPQLNRMLSIAPERPPVEFDWGSTDAIQTEFGRLQLKKRIREKFGENADVFVYHQDEVHSVSGNRQLFAPPAEARYDIETAEPLEFLKDVCVRPQFGLFGIVSQVSPSGGNHFEDLPILDPSDPTQWLLVIAVQQGDDLLIYRKLYTKDP